MKFKIQEFENKNLGKNILLREVNEKDFEKIARLIEELGFKRNLENEKEIAKFCKEKGLTNKNAIYKNYSDKNNDLEIEYDSKFKTGRIRIKLDDEMENKILDFLRKF